MNKLKARLRDTVSLVPSSHRSEPTQPSLHLLADYATSTHLAFSFLLGWMGLLREAAVAAFSASSSSSSVLISSSVPMLPGDPD